MSDDGLDFQPVQSDDIDFQPMTDNTFAENLGSNAARALNPANIAKGYGETVKEGLFDLPKDLTSSLAQEVGDVVTGENSGQTPVGKRLEDIAESPQVQNPGKWAYENPIDAAMLAAAPLSGFVDEGAGARAAENIPKTSELPVVQPGMKTGEPHALFAYNDEFGPNGQPRSVYNIFGDPEHPAIKQAGGFGSSVPKETLDQTGIPITGREPRSVGKWEPLTPTEVPNKTPATNTIGQRLAARTTSQALDLNPASVRRLAIKLGQTPEETVLGLGKKADELIPNLVGPTDTANSKFAKVMDAHDEAGAKIGKLTKLITRGTPSSLPEGQETIDALRKAANEYYQVDGGDLALQKTADRLEALQKDGKLDFDRLSKVKSDIGKGFNKTEPPPGTEDIYHIIDDNAQKVVDRLSVQDPSLAPQLDRLKQIYTTTSRLIPAMSRTAAREVSSNSLGGGVFSKAIPTAIGGAIGGLPGAALAGGAKYLQEAIAPDLGKNLAYMTMKASPKAIQAIQKAMPGISVAEAAMIAQRAMHGKTTAGMSKGGRVPDDVRRYMGC